MKSNKGSNTKSCIWARITPCNSTGWDQLPTENLCGESHGGPGGQRVEQESVMMASCMLGCYQECNQQAAEMILPFWLALVRQHLEYHVQL